MEILSVLLSLYLMILVGVGYRFFGGRVGVEALTGLIMNLLVPCLIFKALLKAKFTIGRLGKLALAYILLVLSLLVLCWCLRRFFDLPSSFELPVLFMNIGFLGIPLMKFYGGDPGVASVIIFGQVQSLLIFTLGIGLVTAHLSLGQQLLSFMKEPIIWAIFAGFVLSQAGLEMTGIIQIITGSFMRVISLTGDAAVPLALFLLGYDLHRFQPKLNGAVGGVIFIRLAFASLLGIGICLLLELKGPDGAAVLLGAGLPSGVFSYILAQRYDKAPAFATGAVFYTSVFSVFSLPLMLYLANLWYPAPF